MTATLWIEREEATPDGPMQGRAGRAATYVHIAARQGKIKKAMADNGDMWTSASPSRAAKVYGLNFLTFWLELINRFLLPKSEDNWNAEGKVWR